MVKLGEGYKAFFIQVLQLFYKLKVVPNKRFKNILKTRYSVYLFWSTEQKCLMTPSRLGLL